MDSETNDKNCFTPACPGPGSIKYNALCHVAELKNAEIEEEVQKRLENKLAQIKELFSRIGNLVVQGIDACIWDRSTQNSVSIDASRSSLDPDKVEMSPETLKNALQRLIDSNPSTRETQGRMFTGSKPGDLSLVDEAGALMFEETSGDLPTVSELDELKRRSSSRQSKGRRSNLFDSETIQNVVVTGPKTSVEIPVALTPRTSDDQKMVENTDSANVIVVNQERVEPNVERPRRRRIESVISPIFPIPDPYERPLDVAGSRPPVSIFRFIPFENEKPGVGNPAVNQARKKKQAPVPTKEKSNSNLGNASEVDDSSGLLNDTILDEVNMAFTCEVGSFMSKPIEIGVSPSQIKDMDQENDKGDDVEMTGTAPSGGSDVNDVDLREDKTRPVSPQGSSCHHCQEEPSEGSESSDEGKKDKKFAEFHFKPGKIKFVAGRRDANGDFKIPNPRSKPGLSRSKNKRSRSKQKSKPIELPTSNPPSAFDFLGLSPAKEQTKDVFDISANESVHNVHATLNAYREENEKHGKLKKNKAGDVSSEESRRTEGGLEISKHSLDKKSGRKSAKEPVSKQDAAVSGCIEKSQAKDARSKSRIPRKKMTNSTETKKSSLKPAPQRRRQTITIAAAGSNDDEDTNSMVDDKRDEDYAPTGTRKLCLKPATKTQRQTVTIATAAGGDNDESTVDDKKDEDYVPTETSKSCLKPASRTQRKTVTFAAVAGSDDDDDDDKADEDYAPPTESQTKTKEHKRKKTQRSRLASSEDRRGSPRHGNTEKPDDNECDIGDNGLTSEEQSAVGRETQEADKKMKKGERTSQTRGGERPGKVPPKQNVAPEEMEGEEHVEQESPVIRKNKRHTMTRAPLEDLEMNSPGVVKERSSFRRQSVEIEENNSEELPAKRARRNRGTVSYKEQNLNTKMRQGYEMRGIQYGYE